MEKLIRAYSGEGELIFEDGGAVAVAYLIDEFQNFVPDGRGGQKNYKNYFGIGMGDGLSGTEMMVDFAQIACVPSNEFPAIMDKKHAQLTDVDRMELKIKLGIFFAQPTADQMAGPRVFARVTSRKLIVIQ